MEENQKPNVIVAKTTKSVGLAFILSALFGPLGMFYSTVVGGIVMLIVDVVVGILTFGFGLIITVPIGVIWATLAASNYNKKLLNGV